MHEKLKVNLWDAGNNWLWNIVDSSGEVIEEADSEVDSFEDAIGEIIDALILIEEGEEYE